MARTDKDRPYEVRAKEASKGVIKHHAWCNGLPRRWNSYSTVTTHIFRANEVKEMNALKEQVAENGAEITSVGEKSGYLISRDPNTYYDRLYGRPVKPVVREKVVATLDGALGDSIVSKFDVFYIFEVTKTVIRNDEDACCGATLPKSMDKAVCPCCVRPVREKSKNKVRGELDSIRKENYNRVEWDFA